jgi:DNA uptake protein ComE-like DNA-binding protein
MIRAFKEYFSITKKEWNGMVVLVVIIALVMVAPYIMQYFHRDEVVDLKEFKKAVAQLKAADTGDPETAHTTIDTHAVLFKFNPNSLPVGQWQKLGLNERQISSIKNYENKGGHFYTKADVQKIYSLTPADYARLQLYIDLPDGELKAKKGDVIIELNTADSAQLTELKGVGPSFAARIVNYRKQLGGFVSKEQLKEIYGIDSAKYNQLVPQVTVNTRKIAGIDINHVTVDDLRPFPYLNFKQMNAIVEYRKQHGNYHSVNDLRDIALLNDEILRKIAPYLKFK